MPGLHRRDSGFRACSGAEASDLVRPASDFSVQLWSACRGAAASRGHAAHACPITVLPGNGYHTDVSPLATPARSCWGLQAGSLAHLPGRGAVLVRRGACQGLRAPCLPFPWVFPCFSSTWVPTVWHCDIRAPLHVPPRDLRGLQREWGSGWRGRAPVFTERGCSGALVKPVCLLALSPVGPALKPPALRNLLCSALIVPGALHMQKGRGVACP